LSTVGFASKLVLPDWDDSKVDRVPSAALWGPLETSLRPEVVDLPEPIVIGPDLVEEIIEEPFDLGVYNKGVAKDYLYDPQHLLSEVQRMDLVSFLSFHAGECSIPIYVLALSPTDEPAGIVDFQSILKRWAKGEPACMVTYFLGDPARAQVYLSEGTDIGVGSSRDTSTLVIESVRAAFVAQNNIDQLERFNVRLSILLFQLEKDGLAAMERELAKDEMSVATPADIKAARSQSHRFLIPWRFIVPPLLVLGVIVGGSRLISALHRVHHGGNHTFVLPEQELPVRLAGQHSGGLGAEISFGTRVDS